MIYLDNASTTKVEDSVLKEMNKFQTELYGNPSSLHEFGRLSKIALEKARKIIADSINALPEEIYFTSSGSESNNLVLKGSFFPSFKNNIITTNVEHSSVSKTCEWLEEGGAKVDYLSVNSEGFIDFEELKGLMNDETLLVSVIHGNNEIGTIQDIKKIGELCRKKKVLFHTDASQSYMKCSIDVVREKIDLLTLDSQKIYGPKGVGAVYIKKGLILTPLIHGGEQERGLRSSTENVAGVVGFAKAVESFSRKKNEKIGSLRDYFIEELLKISGTKLNGPFRTLRLINNVNVRFEGIDSEVLKDMLSDEEVYCSIGSACSGKTRSFVLKAIGLNGEEINSSVRFSLSKYNTKKEIDFVLLLIKKFLPLLRKSGSKKIKSKKKFVVNRKTKFSEILRRKPELKEVFTDLGLSCFVCPLADEETIEMGAEVHKMNPDVIVKDINDALNYLFLK